LSREPDNFEKGIRFGCGGLLGLVLGLYFATRHYLRSENIIISIAIFAGTILGCGFLAMIKGDQFWYSLKDRFWWR
jgi:hypothetical protein